jgi:DNA repair exonuclease SbcCD ATPase subunit
MRKAFDANVPKLKPRLKTVALESTLPLEARVDDAPPVVRVTEAAAPAMAAMTAIARAAEARMEEAAAAPAGVVEPAPPVVAQALGRAPQAYAPEGDDLEARRERLDKIKRRVAEASRPRVRTGPAPGDPSRAAEQVLGLAHDLEAELANARAREAALQADLDATRTELTRTAGEGREALARTAAVEAELEEKRVVLGDMLAEMTALEAERDEALRRAQAMAAIDEERARLLEEVSRRADEEAAGRSDRAAEVERLTEELRDLGADAARLRGALAETARERDGLAAELESSRRDREELNAAKRALEQVHTALSQARARIG